MIVRLVYTRHAGEAWRGADASVWRAWELQEAARALCLLKMHARMPFELLQIHLVLHAHRRLPLC